MLEQILESPLYCKESRPVNPKGNQPWIFTGGGTDAEAEVPKLWPLDEKSWRLGKDLDAGKDQRQKEKGVAEGEIARWHHQLNGHKSEQTPEDRLEEPGMLQAMGSQSVRHNLATEQQQQSSTQDPNWVSLPDEGVYTLPEKLA